MHDDNEEARAQEAEQKDRMEKAMALLRETFNLSEEEAEELAYQAVMLLIRGHERRLDPGWAGFDAHKYCFRIFVDKYQSRYRR